MRKSISPSRTYVAMCNKMNFDGHYFKKFHLPESYTREYFMRGIEKEHVPLENNSSVAAWYFLNHLNFTACLESVISWEDYNNVVDQRE